VRDFLLTVVAALVVAGIGFGVAAFTLGRAGGLAPHRPDGVPFDLPPDRPLSAEDVRGLRFDTALRGYRMSQVDEVLARIAHDLDQLADHFAAVEARLAEDRLTDSEA